MLTNPPVPNEKALVGTFSVIVKTNGSFAALVEIIYNVRGQCGQSECTETRKWSLGYRYLAASLPVSSREGKDFQGKRPRKDFQFAVLLPLCLCTLI